MESSSKKILIGASVFAITIVVAIFGYWIAGWSLLEAIYMVIITIYGVGYGEVRPVDDRVLRLFTMTFIVTGCTSAVFVMGGFVQMIAEGEINKALGARRMNEGIKRLQDHAIVCGFGRVGQILAAELKATDIPFVVVDQNRERLLEAEELGYLVYIGDATEESTLDAVRIKQARVLATVLPNDALNVFITLSARELNEKIEIIARGESSSTRRKLIRSGANEVVMPAAVGATKIAQLITRPAASTLLQNGDYESRLNEDLSHIGVELKEVTVEPDSPLSGTTIGQIEKQTDHGVVVVSLTRLDGSTLSQPDESLTLQAGETLIFLARRETVLKLQSESKPQEIIYRGARLNN